MATKLEIIYDIKEYLKDYSDDAELSNEYILYLYRKKRSKYLRRLFNDFTRKFDNIVLQSFCVGLEEVDNNSCGLETDCKILRSKVKIPEVIDLRSRLSITSIKPSNINSKAFKIINEEQVPYILEKTYNSGVYAFLKDNYIYLISNDIASSLLECINITGLFENPEDLNNYTNCCGCENPVSCFDDNTEYPLQGFLLDDISNEIKKELVSRINIPEDTINNSTEDNE